MMAPFADGDAALQQQSSHLVDHRGAAHNLPLAHSAQRLQVELVVGLDRHKAHRGTGYSLGTRFGINGVVLVHLHVRLHISAGVRVKVSRYIRASDYSRMVGLLCNYHSDIFRPPRSSRALSLTVEQPDYLLRESSVSPVARKERIHHC